MVEIENPEVRVLRNGDYLATDDSQALSVRGENKMDVVEEFYEKFEELGHGNYTFKVPYTGNDTVMLYDGDFPLIVLSESNTSILFDGEEEDSTFEEYQPSQEFWDLVMYINSYTSRLEEFYNHASAYGDDVAGSFKKKDIGQPRSRKIPEYESRIAFEISQRLFENRMESHSSYDKYSRMTKLLREAHIQTGEDVPEYLRVME